MGLFYEDDNTIVGQVINMLKDGITFAGKTVKEAKKDFRKAVDDYLNWVEEAGFEPERPLKGTVFPISHRDITEEEYQYGLKVADRVTKEMDKK